MKFQKLQKLQQDRPIFARLLALGLLVLAGVALAASLGYFDPPPVLERQQPMLWYYDLNTRKLFPGPDIAPPIATDSKPDEKQPAGVRAHVYSCTGCDNKDSHFIAYLETLDIEFRSLLTPEQERSWFTRSEPVVIPEREDPTLVKRPEDSGWEPTSSLGGQDIANAGFTACGEDAVAYECQPAPAVVTQ